MKIKKAYRFKLKPSPFQKVQMESFAGHCRFLWNKILRMNLNRLAQKQKLLWYTEADFWSKLWKSSNEYGFLKECPAHCLQQKLRDLDRAFRDGFDKKQVLKRLPRFRVKGLHDSFRFPEPKHLQIENRRIKFPKLGWVSFFKSQSICGEVKNMTISKSGNAWFVSIQVEQELSKSKQTSKTAIGIDVGIKHFAALSNDQFVEPKNAFKKHEKQLSKEQRKLAKKKKLSSNWKKQKEKVGRIHCRIANIRRDFLHKTSTHLCKSHAIIVVEELKVTNMSRSARGSEDFPGKQVKAKSGLNKAILDQGWGEFRRQLAYKQDWFGGCFLTVNPQYTSQRCYACGHIDKNNRLNQSVFVCLSCGHQDHADSNAAKNIVTAGLAGLACGEIGLPNSVKQEPLRKGDRVSA